MENLFVKSSPINQDKLIAGKKFLLDIVEQVKNAYSNVKHFEVRNHKDKTSVRIGCHNNKGCCHIFSVDMEGIITYTSYKQLIWGKKIKGTCQYEKDEDGNTVETSLVKRLLKDYPESKRRVNCSEFTLIVKIKNQTDFVDKVKDIAFFFERDGFTLKR